MKHKTYNHNVIAQCPNGQTLCETDMYQPNPIKNCPLCEPYMAPRPRKGLAKPNYPVPAIVLHTYIGHEYVQIFEYSRFDIEPYRLTYNKLVLSRYKYS